MAIASLDHIIEASTVFPPKFVKWTRQPGLSTGRALSGWPLPGIPGAGVQATTINGATLSQSAGPVGGAVVIPDAPSGKKNYIGRVTGFQTTQGPLWICDRLWSNQVNRAVTTLQPIASPAWPARDANGSSNGEGVMIGIEVSTALSGGNATVVTLGYTDSDGNSGKTAIGIGGLTSSLPVGTATLFPLGTGEKGVRSVESIQFSNSWTAGVLNLFAYRIIYDLPTGPPASGLDALYQDTGLPEIPNGAVPFMMGLVGSSGSGSQILGMQVLQR